MCSKFVGLIIDALSLSWWLL